MPIKRTVAPSPAPPIFRNDSSASYPTPNQSPWANFKVWDGAKDGVRPYNGFEHVSNVQQLCMMSPNNA